LKAAADAFSREVAALAAIDGQLPSAKYATQAQADVPSNVAVDLLGTDPSGAAQYEFTGNGQVVCLTLGTSLNDPGTVTEGQCL
jgi:hypothetical protein